jgi:hypothetical protein
MELVGFEPTTSCMQNKRSTKLNYSPNNKIKTAVMGFEPISD